MGDNRGSWAFLGEVMWLNEGTMLLIRQKASDSFVVALSVRLLPDSVSHSVVAPGSGGGV